MSAHPEMRADVAARSAPAARCCAIERTHERPRRRQLVRHRHQHSRRVREREHRHEADGHVDAAQRRAQRDDDPPTPRRSTARRTARAPRKRDQRGILALDLLRLTNQAGDADDAKSASIASVRAASPARRRLRRTGDQQRHRRASWRSCRRRACDDSSEYGTSTARIQLIANRAALIARTPHAALPPRRRTTAPASAGRAHEVEPRRRLVHPGATARPTVCL